MLDQLLFEALLKDDFESVSDLVSRRQLTRILVKHGYVDDHQYIVKRPFRIGRVSYSPGKMLMYI